MARVIGDSVTRHMVYPVFPPGKSAEETVAWIAAGDWAVNDDDGTTIPILSIL